ncbi:MAG: hypothetical protein PHO32_10045, partial [Candidatus Cloacimonetes bacterium]|nr:hypothetical protein [Candidatus Cloacimonadota bacterium]
MNKWFLIVIAATLVLASCTANRAVPQTPTTTNEPYTGITTKVAILPLKAMDSQSRYIEKMLSVRDLNHAFASHPQYELLDMEEVAAQFKLSGYKDVDALEVEEMKELVEMTSSDVLATGNITSSRGDSYSINLKLFSARTSELKQLNFSVSKFKQDRWANLETSLIGELDKFISNEVDKIYNIAINYYSSGNYVEAEKSLKVAMGLNPELKDANYYLGASYSMLGKQNDAIEYLNKSLVKDP